MSAIAVVGYSGTGKSTSYGQFPEIGIKGLNPKETVVINVSGKDLPFKGWNKLYTGKISEKGNYLETSNADSIAKGIRYINENRTDIKSIIIDDSQYVMSFEIMRRAKEKGYEKFSAIASDMSMILEVCRTVRKDLNIFFLWHPEIGDDGNLKMKTAGKMLDANIALEGLFTIIFYTRIAKTNDGKVQYQFVTNNDGYLPAKSPYGMFKETYIPNDLGLVSELIEEYNK